MGHSSSHGVKEMHYSSRVWSTESAVISLRSPPGGRGDLSLSIAWKQVFRPVVARLALQLLRNYIPQQA